MSPLCTINGLSKSYGTKKLFHNISFSVQQGAKVGIVGPNGSGKTTLIKIISQQETADEGSVIYQKGLKIGYASQSPHFAEKTFEEIFSLSPTDDPEQYAYVHMLLGKAGFAKSEEKTISIATLSGGWKKRLDIVYALRNKPDLLLLDEPTNHLDLEGIIWLEHFLRSEKTPYLVVSHDRQFLHTVCNSILELNTVYPKGYFAIDGDMREFLERKKIFLEGQRQTEARVASTVRKEASYLERSPKARTTKAKSRVDKAEENIKTLTSLQQLNTTQNAKISFTASERQTRKLLAAKNIGINFANRSLFSGLDFILSPKTRLGLVGKNGTGKTTLLKILAGEIAPSMGTIKSADDLSIVYFDQHRQALPADITLKEALCPHGEFVTYMGQEIHVHGWARRFLFPQDRLLLPISCLSGGEKARVFIAHLMLKPADILLLDEPTNDLDIDTLEIIEENLSSFPGAVVCITHDRFFMNNICTSILYLADDGTHQFFADYAQYESFAAAAKKQSQKPPSQNKEKTPLKQSFKQKWEQTHLESLIAELEKEIVLLQKSIETPSLSYEEQEKGYRQLGELQKKLDASYERWLSLGEPS